MATRSSRSGNPSVPPAADSGTASSYATGTGGSAISAAPAKAISTSDRRVGLTGAQGSSAVAGAQVAISARSIGGSGLSTSTTPTSAGQNSILLSLLEWTRRQSQSLPDPASASSSPSPASASPQPYFPTANWLWQPIASNPVIAADSALWVSYLSAAGTQHVANLYQYSVTLVSGSSVTRRTPRYTVKLTANWGPNPFGSNTVPIPKGTRIPPGSDGQIAIMDPTTGKAFSIWQAKYNSKTNTWSGSWGGMAPISGNGIDTSGSGTGAGISRYAGVVTAAEFSAAIAANTGLSHALVVSSNIAGPGFVGPATKSDGTNIAGVATPIPEGYRIQLDPAIDVDAIPGITPAERVIAKTLQTYGAYVVDQGDATLAFVFQMEPDATSTSNPGAVWTSAGLTWDYYDMADIPWTQLRVIAP